MEEIERAAKEIGHEMDAHPQQASEAEQKIEDGLAQRLGKNTADEIVTKGADELETYGRE